MDIKTIKQYAITLDNILKHISQYPRSNNSVTLYKLTGRESGVTDFFQEQDRLYIEQIK